MRITTTQFKVIVIIYTFCSNYFYSVQLFQLFHPPATLLHLYCIFIHMLYTIFHLQFFTPLFSHISKIVSPLLLKLYSNCRVILPVNLYILTACSVLFGYQKHWLNYQQRRNNLIFKQNKQRTEISDFVMPGHKIPESLAVPQGKPVEVAGK